MNRRNAKMLIVLVVIVFVAMIVQLSVLYVFSKNNMDNTSEVLLNQFVGIIEKNDNSESELISTLKEDYIVRAQAVAYILDANEDAVTDVLELKKIAKLLDVDEIHIFDENGVIYSGTEPKYYGYSFDSGEQMGYFKPMLSDTSLTMCQDLEPNTAEGKSMMYAITWNSKKDKIIQVGIEPVRLMDELRSHDIADVVDEIPTYNNINIIVAYKDTGIICAGSLRELKDTTLSDLNYDESDDIIDIHGTQHYYNSEVVGDYIVMTSYSVRDNINNFSVAMVIEIVYLLLAGLIIIHMLNRIFKANDEKATQMEVLISMSDIYNSMHLIDLKNNTFEEYHARDEVSDVVHKNEKAGAVETMIQAMIATTEDDFVQKALEFTNITTLPERICKKKIITEELKSKSIGWYRASFIVIETDEDKFPTKVVFVTRNIDSEKKREEELVYKSNIDELTTLYNRRAYEDDINDCGDMISKENFVFVSLDVNGLKTINDTLGHVAGDELLIGAADCMKQCFEPYGRVYRIGGDEFAAILFANITQLEKIKNDFEKATSNWTGKLVENISVSCGYVIGNETNTNSIHEIAKIADKRMYEVKAKHYGKKKEEVLKQWKTMNI